MAAAKDASAPGIPGRPPQKLSAQAWESTCLTPQFPTHTARPPPQPTGTNACALPPPKSVAPPTHEPTFPRSSQPQEPESPASHAHSVQARDPTPGAYRRPPDPGAHQTTAGHAPLHQEHPQCLRAPTWSPAPPAYRSPLPRRGRGADAWFGRSAADPDRRAPPRRSHGRRET